ncbi:hypothetical protein K505DRAFT_80803 [Melanomma pulvis-pyrius CBS 109.77]|uniref:Uncharacterized protein n=1 Tax=Melanomma pulvis-pyrius CBS 109.77 TaxID=1314802 RepID=A0A6A6XRL0_9PLEO|nr:hypothetical protein K505DRAFT_80803 [Melanomma pulvis-pyrius CBS 109.77]
MPRYYLPVLKRVDTFTKLPHDAQIQRGRAQGIGDLSRLLSGKQWCTHDPQSSITPLVSPNPRDAYHTPITHLRPISHKSHRTEDRRPVTIHVLDCKNHVGQGNHAEVGSRKIPVLSGGLDAIQVVELWRKQGSERRVHSPEQMTIVCHCVTVAYWKEGKMMPQESVVAEQLREAWPLGCGYHVHVQVGGYSLCNLGV